MLLVAEGGDSLVSQICSWCYRSVICGLVLPVTWSCGESVFLQTILLQVLLL